MISLISIALTAYDFIPYNTYFTAYTNPFNFLIYFQIGRIIREYQVNLKNNQILLISMIISIMCLICWEELLSYFSLYSVLVSFASFIFMYRIADEVYFGEKIGKLSYVIYLVHLVPASALNGKGLQIIGQWFDFIKVPLIFFLIVVLVWLGEFCLKKMNLSRISKYLGYR